MTKCSSWLAPRLKGGDLADRTPGPIDTLLTYVDPSETAHQQRGLSRCHEKHLRHARHSLTRPLSDKTNATLRSAGSPQSSAVHAPPLRAGPRGGFRRYVCGRLGETVSPEPPIPYVTSNNWLNAVCHSAKAGVCFGSAPSAPLSSPNKVSSERLTFQEAVKHPLRDGPAILRRVTFFY